MMFAAMHAFWEATHNLKLCWRSQSYFLNFELKSLPRIPCTTSCLTDGGALSCPEKNRSLLIVVKHACMLHR